MSGAIAIFVKTPGYSAVKTRLAATVGDDGARDWHLRAAHVVAEVAAAAAAERDAAVYWAVAEPEALAARAWPSLPCLAQGAGGLGARMGRVHHELVRRHGAGMLLGADAPQLPLASLQAALAWCAATTPCQALGPAHDGGFWLYAGNRVAVLAEWDSIAYSRADTASRFRSAFAALGAVLELPTLTDLDHGADLPALRRELAALERPLPGQRALAVWLGETFGELPGAGASS